MNNLNKLIEDTQNAYKLLKQFVRDDEYIAYLNGLIDAKNVLVTLEEDEHHEKLDTNSIQTVCSCGERFFYIEDFDKHVQESKLSKVEEES